MRYILIILMLFIIQSCNSGDNVSFKRVNSKELPIYFLVDTNGENIDTISFLRKQIETYLKQSTDTLNVLLSEPKPALIFGRHKLDSVYGKYEMDGEAPFNLTLIDGKYWFLEGSLQGYEKGGVAQILFSKYDGKVLYLGHGK